MAREANSIPIPADSELAKRLKEAAAYVVVDTGEATYRLYIESDQDSQPDPAQVAQSQAGIRAAAGGWQGLVDADAFQAYIAARRRTANRPSVHL